MNKGNKANRNRLMIAGVQKHYGPNDTVPVDGVPRPQPEVVAALQAAIEADDKTSAAEAAYHKAVADGAAATHAADTLFLSLKTYFLDLYKKSPQTLTDYGLMLHVRKEPTAETKAAAAAKRRATRALRGTTGKSAKAAIKAPAVKLVAVPVSATAPAGTATAPAENPPAAAPAAGPTTTKS